MNKANAPTNQKTPEIIPIPPPAPDKRVQRGAVFAESGERRSRYSLPEELQSASPVGYRTRVSLDDEAMHQAMALLSMERPTGFALSEPVTEQELFEESSLGVLVSRQSTNFRGHRQVTFGPEDSQRITHLLRSLDHQDAEVLDGATYTHVILSRPYRTLFTLLLTFVGHPGWISMATVARRALLKRFKHFDDIPTVGYLQQLHIGILADSMERAAVIASEGKRRAQIHSAPFCSEARRQDNKPVLHAIEEMCGMTRAMRAQGWRVALVAQVGSALPEERLEVSRDTCRKLGASLMALRSERILPGVNQEEKAPPQYHVFQDMDVPEELTVMAGRAGYNAFAHWTGYDREHAKNLLMMERIDVLTPEGGKRIDAIQKMLLDVNEKVLRDFPTWANLMSGGAFKRNARTGAKAFGLSGQRVYIGGLSREEVRREGLDWDLAIRAMGAAASRSALLVELMGSYNLPPGCDLLAGICLMAGPVNQNDIGKTFYGQPDLLTEKFGNRNPTSLLVWTLKAKTITDPIGNEEQLVNPKRKGLLVDLRPGPHEAISVRLGHKLEPMRKRGTQVNEERAFADVGNFATDPSGRDIPGNRGAAWPKSLREQRLF